MKGRAVTSPYLSIAQTAAHFGVSYTTIRKQRGIFAALRIVPVNGRKLVVREDVEALDAQLQQPAQPASDGLRLVRKRA